MWPACPSPSGSHGHHHMSIEAQIFTHRRLRNPCAKRESHYGIRGEHHIALGRDEEVGPGYPHRLVTNTSYPQRPCAPSLWLALTQWDSEILSAKISSFKPPAIKHLLGDPNLTIDQLQHFSCTLPLGKTTLYHTSTPWTALFKPTLALTPPPWRMVA